MKNIPSLFHVVPEQVIKIFLVDISIRAVGLAVEHKSTTENVNLQLKLQLRIRLSNVSVRVRNHQLQNKSNMIRMLPNQRNVSNVRI